MNCNHCGRFIHAEFDGENVIGMCSYCDTISIDITKTNEVWNSIDAQRINEDATWINELTKCNYTTKVNFPVLLLKQVGLKV